MDRNLQVGGNHYSKHKIQPWDIIDEYSLNYYEGNAVKYILRRKDPTKRLEDLKKAKHYIEKCIADLSKNESAPQWIQGIPTQSCAPRSLTPAELRDIEIRLRALQPGCSHKHGSKLRRVRQPDNRKR